MFVRTDRGLDQHLAYRGVDQHSLGSVGGNHLHLIVVVGDFAVTRKSTPCSDSAGAVILPELERADIFVKAVAVATRSRETPPSDCVLFSV